MSNKTLWRLCVWMAISALGLAAITFVIELAVHGDEASISGLTNDKHPHLHIAYIAIVIGLLAAWFAWRAHRAETPATRTNEIN